MYRDVTCFFFEWGVLEIGGVRVIMLFLVDWVGCAFSSVVFLISSVVIFYRTFYLSSGPEFRRFVFLVSLFVFSMFLLIFSPNMIRVLLGWDGLGLVSYCLVIFYENTKSSVAGMLTILSNRLGDIFLLVGICWALNFGSCDFMYLQSLNFSGGLVVIYFFVVVGAITKSAQIPFSAWLPAAIAAPTPVSSLVHSRTLVTAGVYLLVRFFNVLGCVHFLFVVSLITIIISGLGARYEIDFRRVVAFSTLRQLGIIIMVISVGLTDLGYFHLTGHALFKSLLFLCAGVYIHSMGDWQDLRIVGGG